MVAHASLTGVNLHEPKGAASASANTVYVADGAGSGTWKKIDSNATDSSSLFLVNKYFISVFITDVSTAQDIYVPVTHASTVSKIVTALEGVITGTDSTVTVRNTAGSSMGTITVTQSGSAAGDIDTLTPVSNNTIAANGYIKISTDGASTGAAILRIIIELTATA